VSSTEQELQQPRQRKPRSKNLNTKFDIEVQSFDIVYRYRRSICQYREIVQLSLISGYNDIEVLNFDINVSSMSYCVEIEVPGFDIEDSSILYWFDIDSTSNRLRMSNPSISSSHIVPDIMIEGHFPTYDLEACTFLIVI
jgi:hypothetical protein